MPPLKSYSGRSSCSTLGFFPFLILVPFATRSSARADDLNPTTVFTMRDHDQALLGGCAHRDEPLFVHVGIQDGQGQSVRKHGARFLEGDPMLPQIVAGLDMVPLESIRSRTIA
jgi:hypothetical protein